MITVPASPAVNSTLQFEVGELVQVRCAAEIFATLDPDHCLDGLPFMPEMLRFCGRRMRVLRNAHKLCVSNGEVSIRGMSDTVTLGLARCSGCAHGDCDARCVLLWKAAWLKKVDTLAEDQLPVVTNIELERELASKCRVTEGDPVRYRCQATALNQATYELPWWSLSQYGRDLRQGVSVYDLVHWLSSAVWRRCSRLVSRSGRAATAALLTPSLKPGDRVRVKSKRQITETLDEHGFHYGLWWDPEMDSLCGRTFTILHRVDQVIDERTGELRRLGRPTVVLQDAFCSGRMHRFCARNSFFFWRECWLDRIDGDSTSYHSRPWH